MIQILLYSMHAATIMVLGLLCGNLFCIPRCIPMCILLYYSSSWIKTHGEEYHQGDYILIGKQVDDLPVFAKITDLIVIVDYPVAEVNVCRTVGLVNHLMSYLLVLSLDFCCVSLLSLVESRPYTAHTFDDGNLYVTLRSNVEIGLLRTIE